MQFSALSRVDHGASETPPILGSNSGQQNAGARCNRLVEVVNVRPKGEVRHRSLDDTYGEDTRRVDIDEYPQMILELPEHVEGAGGDAFPEDRGTRLYQRTPRAPI